MKRIIWFCLIFTCTLALPAQTSVALVFNDQDIETGDTFSVRVLVSGTNARPDRVNFSAWRDFLPPENILRSSAWTRSGNNWVSEHKLIVFDAVDTIMPPFSVYLLAGEPVFSNPIKWKVRATATNGELSDMAPQRDIRREALQWTDFALLAALLVVLYGLYRVFFQKKKKALVVNPPQQEAPVSTAPAVPFHELALQELKRLEREKPWLKGKVKSYYSDLSHILNQYIESQYKVPALESTTRELEILLRSTPFPPQRMELLLGVLRQADLVKYAQAHEQKQAHEHYLLKAEELIKKTATEAS